MVVDSNLFIEHLRARDKATSTLSKISDEPQLFISAVSLYELYMGATTPEKRKDVLAVTEDLVVLPFTKEVAERAGQIYQHLRARNELIEFRDIFIAATCLVNSLPIATLNKKHFKRINGLKILR